MISIIIPTFNEGDGIAQAIARVRAAATTARAEIILVDGGSSDGTAAIAMQCGVRVIISSRKGRAAQMNAGAAAATDNTILYFLHADSIPPPDFTRFIAEALKKGYSSGCFRLSFDHTHWFLKANAWATRFNVNAVRFGDQSLFVTPSAFKKCGGFREDLLLMEDQEIIHRLKKVGRFIVMKAQVTTSARKYLDNGIYRLQGIFFRIWLLYYLGYSQEYLLQRYRKWIQQNKL